MKLTPAGPHAHSLTTRRNYRGQTPPIELLFPAFFFPLLIFILHTPLFFFSSIPPLSFPFLFLFFFTIHSSPVGIIFRQIRCSQSVFLNCLDGFFPHLFQFYLRTKNFQVLKITKIILDQFQLSSILVSFLVQHDIDSVLSLPFYY